MRVLKMNRGTDQGNKSENTTPLIISTGPQANQQAKVLSGVVSPLAMRKNRKPPQRLFDVAGLASSNFLPFVAGWLRRVLE